MAEDNQLTAFLQALRDTIDWCEPRATITDIKNCLRSDSLSPYPFAGRRSEVVDSVVRERHIYRKDPSSLSAYSLAQGKLLDFMPDQNMTDGMAEEDSYGFFDVTNVPPWDTWVAYVEESPSCNYLVCWVPRRLIGVATAGINVNAEGCIAWLDDTNFLLRQQLAGVLI